MIKLTFDQLVGLLPTCEVFPTDGALPRGVSYGNIIPEFTAPDVALVEGSLDKAQALIVAAPGAVGKSTLAKALSSQRGALIWDLAEAEEVGYGSLDAVLERTMAPGLKSDFLEWMTEGIQFVIIDALDEGRIKVNENSFIRLLENISRLAKRANGICFVLLGRTQIAEAVWLNLTDLGIDASILILSQKVCAGRSRTNVPTPGYNIQSLVRILPQHTVALRCAKSLELPQNGFLRGNQS